MMPGEVLPGKPEITAGKVQVPALPATRAPFSTGETCDTAYNEVSAPVAEVVRPVQAYPVARTSSLCSYAVIAMRNASITPNLPLWLLIK